MFENVDDIRTCLSSPPARPAPHSCLPGVHVFRQPSEIRLPREEKKGTQQRPHSIWGGWVCVCVRVCVSVSGKGMLSRVCLEVQVQAGAKELGANRRIVD